MVVECVIDDHLCPVLRWNSILLLVGEEIVVDGRLVQEAAKANSAAGTDAGGVVLDVVELLLWSWERPRNLLGKRLGHNQC